jgi:hypothetical protein
MIPISLTPMIKMAIVAIIDPRDELTTPAGRINIPLVFGSLQQREDRSPVTRSGDGYFGRFLSIKPLVRTDFAPLNLRKIKNPDAAESNNVQPSARTRFNRVSDISSPH